MEFLSERLNNGLDVVVERNPDAYSMAVGFFVRTGSRDETPEVSGVSHFLEHMLFKGTPRRTADDVNREFDEIGARHNAYTSEETTVFYAAVLPECQRPVVELLADILRPSLRVDDFETEKQVILEEIRMYEDQPPFGADERCRELFFGDHPLGRRVLGTVQSITELTAEAMRGYFQRRYGPENMVLAAAGNVDFDGLVATAEACCRDWEPAGASRPLPPAVPRQAFLPLRKAVATQQYGLQMAAAPAADDPRRFAAKLLAMILGDDSGSRFYWELVDPGRAESVSMHHCEYEGSGSMLTFLSCEPRLGEDCLERIAAVCRAAARDGVTEEELEQAKNKARSRIVLAAERPRGRLFSLGPDWLYRREYRSVEDDLIAVDRLTVDQLGALVRDFPLGRTATVTIGPGGPGGGN